MEVWSPCTIILYYHLYGDCADAYFFLKTFLGAKFMPLNLPLVDMYMKQDVKESIHS